MQEQARIPLWKNGEIVASALVDPDIYDSLGDHVWSLSSGGYAVRWEKIRCDNAKSGWRTVVILMHRQVLGIIDRPDLWGDHKHGDKLDNRRSELSAVTPRQNRHNSKSASATGVKGVSLHPSGKYEARVNLGLFDAIEDAEEMVKRCHDWLGRPQVVR